MAEYKDFEYLRARGGRVRTGSMWIRIRTGWQFLWTWLITWVS